MLRRMVHPEDREFRRRLIARVETLRREVIMSRLVFFEQIGPVAAKRWARFMTASSEDAWSYFPLKQIDHIADEWETGACKKPREPPRTGVFCSCRTNLYNSFGGGTDCVRRLMPRVDIVVSVRIGDDRRGSWTIRYGKRYRKRIRRTLLPSGRHL